MADGPVKKRKSSLGLELDGLEGSGASSKVVPAAPAASTYQMPADIAAKLSRHARRLVGRQVGR